MIATYENATIVVNGKPFTQVSDVHIEDTPAGEPLLAAKAFSVTLTCEVKTTRAMRRALATFSAHSEPGWKPRERRHFERPPTRGYWKGCGCRGCKTRKAVDAVRPANVNPWDALARLAVGLPADWSGA